MPPLTPVKIDPVAVYHAGDVALILDVPLATLDKARRDGNLPFVRRGNRIFITGRAVLDWLTPDDRSEVATP